MIQTKTEIQKLIRKEKPVAEFMYVRNRYIYYKAKLGTIPILFQIPFDDTGTAQFDPTMPSQLLIRYLID